MAAFQRIVTGQAAMAKKVTNGNARHNASNVKKANNVKNDKNVS